MSLRGRRISDEKRAEIARRYEAGQTINFIAVATSAGPQTVRRVLESLGIPRRKGVAFTVKKRKAK